MEFLEACKELIGIDSSPSNGTGDASRFIEGLGKRLGFKVLLEEEIQKGINEANVVCFSGMPEKKVHLMLQTHLDTYNPGPFALWHKTGKNPYHATIHNDNIYGLGVADTKLDFLCKLYAAKKFIGKKPLKSFAVVGTYGEEYNMNGAIRLLRKTVQADRVLVSEPTNFDLVTAGKGLANLEITIPFSAIEMKAKADHDAGEGQSAQCKIFRGVPAHSSQPQKGDNAIEKLFEFFKQMPDQLLVLEIDGGTNYNSIPIHSLVEFDTINISGTTVNQKIVTIYDKVIELKKQFESIKDANFDPPFTTFNIGMVRTYSDHLKIMGCVRWPVAVDENLYLKWMDELQELCQSIGAVFRVRDFKKPFSENTETDFVKKCHEAIRDEEPSTRLATQPVTNEANVFHKLGLETLVFGPGVREGNSQTPDEFVSIDNLYKAIRIYEKVIEKICF